MLRCLVLARAGVFLALLLRYDHHLAQKRAVEGHVSKWYFWHGMVGYFVGLTTTVLVMYQFQAAQVGLAHVTLSFYHMNC